MEKSNRRIYMILTTAVLTFAGLLAVIISFYGQFYVKYGYSRAGIIFFAAAFTVVFSVLFYTVKKWAVWAGFAVLFGLFFLIFREALIGGTAYAVNEVINETSGYFNTDMYYIDISRYFLRQRNEVMALYAFVLLLSALYAFCFSTPRLSFIPWIVSLLLIVYPLVLEKYPGGFWIMFGIMYLLVTAVTAMGSMRMRGGAAKEGGLFSVQLLAIALGAMVCLAGAVAMGANPEKGFKRSDYFSEVYDNGKDLVERYKNGELAVNKFEDFLIALNPFKKKESSSGPGQTVVGSPVPAASGTASRIGAGELGQVDELLFSGNEVLQVIMPDMDGKVYVKGYIGARYMGDRWSAPETDSRVIYLNNIGFHSQTMLSDYFEAIAASMPVGMVTQWPPYGAVAFMPIDTVSTTMWVRYTAGESSYKFLPLYPDRDTMDELDVYSGDAGFKDFSEDTGIKFNKFDENQLGKIDDVYRTGAELPEELKKFVGLEEQYREYVYDTYLNVNTTMADRLYSQWGGSDIDGAAARYATACSIRKYLNENCKYTTKPGKVPEGRDFVEYFLEETHEGYCTYFATSAVMMLRSAGIPARYVEGYSFHVGGGSSVAEEKVLYQVRGTEGIQTPQNRLCRIKSVPDSAAHAWVEYYVDGVGWVDFEVTPGNYTQVQEERPTQPSTTAPSQTKENTTTAKVDKPTSSSAHTTGGSAGESGFRFKIRLSRTAQRILVCAVVFAALVSVLAVIIKIRHKKVEELYKKMYNIGDGEQGSRCVARMYGDYRRMLRKFGYVQKEYETEADFADRVAGKCSFVSRSEAEKMAELFERATFDREGVSGAQAKEYGKLHSAVMERMYDSVGTLKKLIFKYIFNFM